jgi:hypothetical protein
MQAEPRPGFRLSISKMPNSSDKETTSQNAIASPNAKTLAELEGRWQKALEATRRAVRRHPDSYRELKKRVAQIASRPLDIREYLPAVERIVHLLHTLDPNEAGSIFDLFRDRFKPSSIWQVPLLRVECRDLLAHLEVFEDWRLATRRLSVVK